MKGFTLLEVMIALAVMAGVLLTVISSFNYHLSLASRDREETIAALLARSRLDDPGFDLTRKNGTFAPDWPDLEWQAEVSPSPLPGVDKLTFTVTWDSKRKNLSFVRYQTR